MPNLRRICTGANSVIFFKFPELQSIHSMWSAGWCRASDTDCTRSPTENSTYWKPRVACRLFDIDITWQKRSSSAIRSSPGWRWCSNPDDAKNTVGALNCMWNVPYQSSLSEIFQNVSKRSGWRFFLINQFSNKYNKWKLVSFKLLLLLTISNCYLHAVAGNLTRLSCLILWHACFKTCQSILIL